MWYRTNRRATICHHYFVVIILYNTDAIEAVIHRSRRVLRLEDNKNTDSAQNLDMNVRTFFLNHFTCFFHILSLQFWPTTRESIPKFRTASSYRLEDLPTLYFGSNKKDMRSWEIFLSQIMLYYYYFFCQVGE